MKAKLVALIALASASSAIAAEPIDKALVASHQRCVFDSFVKGVQAAQKFEPGLLSTAVANCEFILQPVKEQIVASTKDTNFAEQILEMIRGASRKGVVVAVIGYFGSGKEL
jgi:hypothetical protein